MGGETGIGFVYRLDIYVKSSSGSSNGSICLGISTARLVAVPVPKSNNVCENAHYDQLNSGRNRNGIQPQKHQSLMVCHTSSEPAGMVEIRDIATVQMYRVERHEGIKGFRDSAI